MVRKCFANWVRGTVCLLAVCLPGGCQRHCERHEHYRSVPLALRESEHMHKEMVLSFVKSSALSLFAEHRETVWRDNLGIELAHTLLKVHETFSDTCLDHGWHDSLYHKVCDAVGPHHEAVLSSCNSSSNAGSYTPCGCLCSGFDKLLRDCAHHVVPWAFRHHHEDDTISGNLCMVLDRDCSPGCAHPVLGLCRYLQYKQLLRTSRVGTGASSHEQHGTTSKFRNWRHHATKTRISKTHSDAAHRIHHASRSSRNSTRGNNTSPQADGLRAMAIIPHVHSNPNASALPREHPNGMHKATSLSSCRVPSPSPPHTICVQARHDALRNLTMKAFPGCPVVASHHLVTDVVHGVVCTIGLTWARDAMRLYHKPCKEASGKHPNATWCTPGAPTAPTLMQDPARHTVVFTRPHEHLAMAAETEANSPT